MGTKKDITILSEREFYTLLKFGMIQADYYRSDISDILENNADYWQCGKFDEWLEDNSPLGFTQSFCDLVGFDFNFGTYETITECYNRYLKSARVHKSNQKIKVVS